MVIVDCCSSGKENRGVKWRKMGETGMKEGEEECRKLNHKWHNAERFDAGADP